MATATTKTDLHARLMKLAEDMIPSHIENDDDGTRCFNLYRFMERLEDRLETEFNKNNAPNLTPTGYFHLSATEVARYLWVCLALKHGTNAYPDRFQDMPVLD